MEVIKINKKPYDIPTSWYDVKLEDWLYLIDLPKDRYRDIEFTSKITGVDSEIFKQAPKQLYPVFHAL